MNKRTLKGIPTRVLSLLMVLAMLLSLSTVFASAAEEEEVEQDQFQLLYNRTFDEGWAVSNGLSLTPKNNVYEIDYERNELMEYNYFMRFICQAEGDAYASVSFGGERGNGAVVEMDFAADGLCDLGRIMYFRTLGQDNPTVLYTANNYLYAFSISEETKLFKLDTNWKHIAIVFTYNGEDFDRKSGELLCTVYFETDSGEMDSVSTVFKLKSPSTAIEFFRLGCPANVPKEEYGSGYQVDNLKVYHGVDEVREITSDMGYGTKVSTTAAKTETIISNDPAQQTTFETILKGVSMKINSNWGLFNGVRREIMVNEEGELYGAPIRAEDGTIMVPLDAVLECVGYPAYMHDDGLYIDISAEVGASYICIGKDTATVNGEKIYLTAPPAVAHDKNGNSYVVIAMDDVEAIFPGYFVTYDEMGLIIICTVDEIVNRYDHLTTLTDIMKMFLFDNPSPEQVYADAKENTNNFTHPYILSTQADHDRMYEAYQAGLEDGEKRDTFYKILAKHVSSAESSYKKYALPKDGTYDEYVGMNPEKYPVMPYPETNGYDPDGGRSSPNSHTDHLRNLAAGYVITHNVKYVYLAYDLALAMGEWAHWGPGHFLNCADASSPFAIYFDWCYNINEELGLDNAVLAEILYRQGVYQGWRSSMFLPLDHYRKQGNASNYTDRNNNWVGVCVAGMTLASLAIMGYDEYVEKASWLISDNLFHMTDTGYTHYAPDGAYIEGPGYWAYGSNNIFLLCYCLDVAIGTNYCLMDGWCIDTTSYYALHVESNEYRSYNYHDGSMGSVATNWFFYVGEYFEDYGLVDIRFKHIRSKGYNFSDLVSYPHDYVPGDTPDLQLDYYAGGIDLYTARSSWEKGAMFVAIHGGNNNVTHGQVDAGSFVYHNAGTVWFEDMGTENYNCAGFWGGTTRYRYYRMKPEGNNTIALTSDVKNVPYGQEANAIAETFDHLYNEYGSSIKIDMTPTLDGLAMKATRGVLVTNDRQTVVIQDEISFGGIQTLYWFGHYSSTYVTDVSLSQDKRTAYMYDKNGNVLRATIVSKVKGLRWSLMDCYTFVHNDPTYGTFDDQYSLDNGTGVPQNSRANFTKLAIKAQDVLSFDCAVVLELVDPKQEVEVGYTWTDMHNWAPTEDNREELVVSEAKNRTVPKKGEVQTGVIRLSRLILDGKMVSDDVNSIYRALTDVTYVTDYFEGDFASSFNDALNSYAEYRQIYQKYIDCVNETGTTNKGVIGALLGVGV